jgi:hypothetical protein
MGHANNTMAHSTSLLDAIISVAMHVSLINLMVKPMDGFIFTKTA